MPAWLHYWRFSRSKFELSLCFRLALNITIIPSHFVISNCGAVLFQTCCEKSLFPLHLRSLYKNGFEITSFNTVAMWQNNWAPRISSITRILNDLAHVFPNETLIRNWITYEWLIWKSDSRDSYLRILKWTG